MRAGPECTEKREMRSMNYSFDICATILRTISPVSHTHRPIDFELANEWWVCVLGRSSMTSDIRRSITFANAFWGRKWAQEAKERRFRRVSFLSGMRTVRGGGGNSQSNQMLLVYENFLHTRALGSEKRRNAREQRVCTCSNGEPWRRKARKHVSRPRPTQARELSS